MNCAFQNDDHKKSHTQHNFMTFFRYIRHKSKTIDCITELFTKHAWFIKISWFETLSQFFKFQNKSSLQVREIAEYA